MYRIEEGTLGLCNYCQMPVVRMVSVVETRQEVVITLSPAFNECDRCMGSVGVEG